MNLLKKFTRKRVEQDTTREFISNEEFPIITDEMISLIEYIGKQMETEPWYSNLSESARFGILQANSKIASRLIDIKKRNDLKYEEE